MFYIKLTRRAPGLDDVYVTRLTARQVKGIGPFEFACYPLRDACRAFKTPAAALAALAKLGYTDSAGAPLAPLKANGVTAVDIVEG